MAKIKPSQRLKTVLKLAKLREQQAAVRLSASVRTAAAEQQQLQQLTSFQNDYNVQFKSQGQVPVSASQLNNYLHFFNNLDSVLSTQQQRREHAEKELERMRSQWQHTYSRQKNIASLIGEKEVKERREDENKSQRVLDDRITSNKNMQ